MKDQLYFVIVKLFLYITLLRFYLELHCTVHSMRVPRVDYTIKSGCTR